MKLNRKIKKLLTVVGWLAVGAGMTTLLVAANNKPEVHSCKQVVISIQGERGQFYIDKNDVYGQIKYATGGGVVGKPIAEVDLSELEGMLEGQTWIRDAELYFDSRNVLHVLIAERDPIARVFTTEGKSFYIDSAGMRMPLLPGVSARLPVVTGFTAAKKLGKGDSALLKDITYLAQYINSHNFWQAQIAQIDITANGNIELMPVVGNHVIRIGNTEDLEEKLERLFLFYKEVLRKTGFDKYGVVDVQFKDQVIGIKSKMASAVDSIQLQKNIQELV
ncbi:MAG: cell division protein FtsQ/DivIB, partial [Chitinophagaceae bacterium]